MRDAGTKSIPLPAFLKNAPASIALEAGLQVGRYQLLAPIARGGMAEVWVARFLGDLGFSRLFALKTIRSEFMEDPSFRERFFEEARIAARLRHSNIVEVVDLGEEGSILFQAMTLVEGDSLASLMRARRDGGGFDPTIAARILGDTLAGLHAAHELIDDHGVKLELVHRDVSPHNILVGIDGVSKLTDFGVAKVLGGIPDEVGGGEVRGKPGYLAPEQVEKKAVDRRTDVFACGVVLWELLTGKKLYSGDPTAAPDPREHQPNLSPALANVVTRALHLDPKFRYSTAAEMSDALDASTRAASAKDVAKLVEEVCGAHVAEMRASVRKAVVAEPKRLPPSAIAAGLSQPAATSEVEATEVTVSGDGIHEETTSVQLEPIPMMKPKRSAARGLAVVVGAGLLFMWIGIRLFTSDPEPPKESSNIVTKLPPVEAPEPVPVAETAAEPEPESELDRSDGEVEERTRPARSGRREHKRPKPKFANPYKR
jgi:serine/threonine-protein kinase